MTFFPRAQAIATEFEMIYFTKLISDKVHTYFLWDSGFIQNTNTKFSDKEKNWNTKFSGKINQFEKKLRKKNKKLV